LADHEALDVGGIPDQPRLLSHPDEERHASMEAMMTPPTHFAAMIAGAPVRT